MRTGHHRFWTAEPQNKEPQNFEGNKMLPLKIKNFCGWKFLVRYSIFKVKNESSMV